MKSNKLPEVTLKKDINKILIKGVEEGVFPCAASGIFYRQNGERKEIINFVGNAALFPVKRELKKNDFFDLASLTKPLATTLAVLCLVKMKKISLDEKISSIFNKKVKEEKKGINIRQLLSHSAGFPAHRDYFTLLRDVPDKEKSDKILTLLLNEKIEYEPGSQSVYSDLGFMLLGKIIEKRGGCSLAEFVEKKVLKPIHLQNKIFYNPLHSENKKKGFVATEKCTWRNKVLTGEVHDDNCYAMGGIAGHSGLFGNIEGVTDYTCFILDMWKNRVNHPNIANKDLKKFLTRQPIPGSCWALGFDTPAVKESSSGKHFTSASVGHLGFTGTSFWIDPIKEIVVVLLTNRVHPDRANIQIRKFRPLFHDYVMEKIFGAT